MSAPNTTESNFKTRLCKTFVSMGMCPNGFNCGYAHGVVELRTTNGSHGPHGAQVLRYNNQGGSQGLKTVMCKNWMENQDCQFGNRCNFAHGEEQLKVKPPESMDESDDSVGFLIFTEKYNFCLIKSI